MAEDMAKWSEVLTDVVIEDILVQYNSMTAEENC